LYDFLKPHVTRVVVCDPRKNPLLRVGNHNDREDARKLSELLYLNKLSSVFHGETEIRTLRELARSQQLQNQIRISPIMFLLPWLGCANLCRMSDQTFDSQFFHDL